MTRLKPAAAIVAAIVGAGTLAAVTVTGAATYAKAMRPPEDDGKYSNVQAASYPGSRLVDDMATREYNGTGMKRIQRSEAPLMPDRCGGDEEPARSMLYSRSGRGDDYSITAQAYGAGQARSVYDGLSGRIASCTQASRSSTAGRTQYTAWQGGYLMTAGDAIVSVTVPDQSRQQEVMEGVTGMLEGNLKDSGCVALDESADDSRRSFYYDSKAYKGLTRVEEVSATRKRIDIAVPQNLADAGGDTNALYVKPILRAVPESPLPAGMQGSLPATPEIPQIPRKADTPPDANAIEYRVEDTKGPGCGWSWSGQKTPGFDTSILRDDYRKTKGDAVKSMDQAILEYNGNARSWSMSALWTMRFVNTWNQYVGSVNAIQDRWNRLDAGREAFRPTWMGYIQSLKDWETSRLNRQAAIQDRDAEITDCTDSRQREWSGSNPGKTPDDGQKDTWKRECDASAPRPDTSPIPGEPSAPEVPKEITIPQSWPTRDQAVSQADATFKANRDALQQQRDSERARAREQADRDAKEQADRNGHGNAPSPSPSPSQPSISPSPSPSVSEGPGVQGGRPSPRMVIDILKEGRSGGLG